MTRGHRPERREFEIDGCVAVVTDYAPNSFQDFHEHDYDSLAFVLAGKLHESVGTGTRVVGPGTLLVKPAGVRHADEYRDFKARVLSLRQGARHTLRSRRWFEHVSAYRIVRSPPLTQRWLQLYSALRQGGGIRSLVGRLDEIAGVIGRDAAPAPIGSRFARFARMAAAIEHDPTRSTVDLAREFGGHPVALARDFKRVFGCSPSAYARRVRAERAAGAVVAGESIASAATEFSDQAHFTRVLKSEFGFSPAAFREIACDDGC